MNTSKLNEDPLSFLIDHYGYDYNMIQQLYSGEKYLAVLLKNGNIGVCATLGNVVSSDIKKYTQADVRSIPHRIVINAYFCALLNYNRYSFIESDLFDYMDFRKYKRIVMVGYFASMIKKFEKEGIPLSIFDMKISDAIILPETEKENYLKKANAVILTSTSIFNNTFSEIINKTPENCDILLLGPSSIMSPILFQYRNVKFICGALFEPSDFNLLNIIENDGGTKDFLKYENKKMLKREL